MRIYIASRLNSSKKVKLGVQGPRQQNVKILCCVKIKLMKLITPAAGFSLFSWKPAVEALG